METTKTRYHTDLIFSNLLFGINFSYYVSLIKHYVFFQDLFFLQIAASALFFIPFAIFSRRYRDAKLEKSDIWRILVVTVLVVYGYMFMQLWGAKYTNPIDASTIATLGPAMTLVTSAILIRKKISWVQFVGVLLSVAGAAMLIFDRGVISDRGGEGFGNVLILVSVISAAVNTVIIKPVLLKLGTLVVMGWYYIIGLAITAPFFAKQAFSNYYLGLPPNALMELLYILILGTILPSYLLYRGTEKLTSVHTALYRYIQPIVATGLAVWRGQETIDRSNLISAGMIFLGIILVVAAYESVLRRIRHYFRDGGDAAPIQEEAAAAGITLPDPPPATPKESPATPSGGQSSASRATEPPASSPQSPTGTVSPSEAPAKKNQSVPAGKENPADRTASGK